jgi:hypothetical protein
MAINKDRLLKLAEYLETSVKPEEFDMRYWKCGTVACAMGHACSIPEFIEAGLYLEFTGTDEGGRCEYGVRMIDHMDHILYGFDVAGELFNITRDQASYLFSLSDDDYDDETPAYVASRIREFVKQNGG